MKDENSKWIIRINMDHYGPFDTEAEAREYYRDELQGPYRLERPSFVLLHK